ncbi:MAG: ATP-binding protein [Candidatus Cloacimonetes bacterium]|jgi:MinD superfamily P-loop ATPase|nr:ATP-binding protein [Candidatus Cloacimonadota bacterium]MDD3143591.1 ATP-binding protein [Candidatus Cloacimonadota bacterium]MDY0367298.1 ATP-binding protein [Candidatus Syntrophosphaera sp.]
MKIAIASGKGGTGKTTLAVNLALRAAETRNVVLADLDVEEPNSAIFIRGDKTTEQRFFRAVPNWEKEACTLCGKCAEVCQFNAVVKLGETILVLPQLCHSCFACSELCPVNALPMRNTPLGWLRGYQQGRLVFLESKLDVGEEMAAPLIKQTISYMDEKLSRPEFQFRDCPPGTACPVIAATSDADLVLLVTEPTPFGLYDLELAVETMRQLDKSMAVVINRWGIGDGKVLRFCEKEQLPVWAIFPNQRKIAELYSRGELIYPEVQEFREGLDAILARLNELKEASE